MSTTPKPFTIISCSKYDLLEILTPIIAENASFRAIDCRLIGNPHHDPELTKLTGLDVPVQEECMRYPLFMMLYERIVEDMLAKEFKTLVTWCYGGRHRSVSMAEAVAKALRAQGREVELSHPTMKKRGLI